MASIQFDAIEPKIEKDKLGFPNVNPIPRIQLSVRLFVRLSPFVQKKAKNFQIIAFAFAFVTSMYDASIYDVSNGRGVTGYLGRPRSLSTRRA